MDMAARASTSQSSIPRDENVVLEVECSSSIPLSSAMDTLDLQQKKVFELISLFRKFCQQADQSESCKLEVAARQFGLQFSLQRPISVQILTTAVSPMSDCVNKKPSYLKYEKLFLRHAGKTRFKRTP
jgi:hypothetical protein